MADLVLQDEVDRISVQLRVPGEDLLGPGSVFLQGFGVVGRGHMRGQQVGQIEQLLL